MSAIASRVIDRHARRVMRPLDAKLSAKAQDAGSGFIEGYAATWGNVDLLGETMIRGCFARSIQQAIPAGKVKLMVKHFRDGGDTIECIGTVTQAKEDDYGLWVHADLSSVELAQETRTKVLEGHVNGLSVGYWPLQWDIRSGPENKDILAHLECKLFEVTVTVRPVNEQAFITGAKSLPEKQKAVFCTENPPVAPSRPEAAQGTDAGVGGIAKALPATPQAPPALPRVSRELAIARAKSRLAELE